MIYAQIINNTIVNIIDLEDPSLLSLFQTDPNGRPYDSVVQIDNLNPQPGIGWTFDNVNWNPPLTPPTPQDAFDACAALVQDAMDFGQSLILQFAAQNVLAGITQAGMAQAVINYTTNLIPCLSSGSLYAAVSLLEEMIADTSSAKIGAYATTTDTIDSPNITFTANTLGKVGNSISLIFDGVSAISVITGNWNTANPSNQVSYTGLSTVIPTAQTISPSGGIPSLAPFVTNNVLYAYLNQIQAYLSIPLTPNPGQ